MKKLSLSLMLTMCVYVLGLNVLGLNVFVATGQAQTQLEMTQGACDEYKKSDAELNSTYKQLIAQKKEKKAFVNKLKLAQRSWLTFRDAHIESIYTGPRSQYGSVLPMCECNALAELTQQRTQQLKRMMVFKEGDVCNWGR